MVLLKVNELHELMVELNDPNRKGYRSFFLNIVSNFVSEYAFYTLSFDMLSKHMKQEMAESLRNFELEDAFWAYVPQERFAEAIYNASKFAFTYATTRRLESYFGG